MATAAPVYLGVTMDDEVIGPDRAREYLALAAPNRHVRPGVVSQYARDMRADRWHSSVIRFGTDGLLYDGQHRLRAVVESDTDQMFWVERGVPLEAMTSVDMGIRRTVGDVLTFEGEQHANVLGAAARLARHVSMFPGIAPSGMSKQPVSTDEILEYVERNPEIRHSVQLGTRVGNFMRFTPSVVAALHYLEMGRSRPAAIEFWDQILTGAEMRINTGPYALRERVMSDRLRPVGTRMDQNMLVAVSIKAWNYWERGMELRQLRWNRGGERAEPFPVLGKKPE